MIPQIKVGNTWLSSIGSWGDHVIERRLQGGSYEMSWAMTSRLRHRDLVPGAQVSAWVGPRPYWVGTLSERESDWAAGEYVAEGLCRQGEQAVCLTSGGITTSTPNTFVDNAITRGWVDWERVASISTTAMTDGDETADFNSVEEGLSTFAEDEGKRWNVNPRGLVSVEAISAATTPQAGFWDVVLDGDRLGTSAEKLVGTVVARWSDSAAGGALKTAIIGTGRPMEKVDLTTRGPITSAKVTSICNAILAKSDAQAGILGAFELTRSQIQGRPLLSMVTEGHRLRLRGQHDMNGLSASPVCTVDEVSWDVAEGTLTITPLAAPQRDLASIIEEAA